MEKRYYNSKVIIIVIVTLACATIFVSCNGIDSQIKLGVTNLELGDYKRASNHFEAVLEKKPSSYYARLGLGKALLQEFSTHPSDTGLIADCLTQLEAARSLRPDSEVEKILSIVWYKRAINLLTNKDTIAALTALSRSTGYDPNSINPLNLAGILYFNKGDHDKALNLFKLVTSTDSSSVQGYFNIAMVYWADSNYTNAYKFWYQAALRSPEDKEIITWAAMAKKRADALSDTIRVSISADKKATEEPAHP
jgi:tetratricopeptide (TPR) repeat protein